MSYVPKKKAIRCDIEKLFSFVMVMNLPELFIFPYQNKSRLYLVRLPNFD